MLVVSATSEQDLGRRASDRRGEFTDAVMMRDPDRRASLFTEDGVWGIAWSPDGEVLATSSDDGTVQLWDKTNRTVRVLQGHPEAGWANPITWSPDGLLLAAGRRSGLV